MATETRVPDIVAVHCSCGASCIIKHVPASKVETLLAIFREAHQGEEHEPCGAAKASRARRAAERAESEA